MSRVAEVEAKIRAEVSAAKVEGWCIRQGLYYLPRCGNLPSAGCPLAVCVRHGFDGRTIEDMSNQARIREAAAAVLDINLSEAMQIVTGFDATPGCGEFYDLGVRLRDVLDEP